MWSFLITEHTPKLQDNSLLSILLSDIPYHILGDEIFGVGVGKAYFLKSAIF